MNWKPIAAANGYEISDCGNVRNSRTNKMLAPWLHRSGHRYINCGGRKYQVHRLVMAAFGPARPNHEAEVRHLDGCPANNNIANLAWGSRAQNIADYVSANHRFPKSAVTFETAAQIRAALMAAKRGQRPAIAARFGVSVHVVNDIACGKTYRAAFTKEAA